MKRNNIVNEWLEKYGDSNIDEQVKLQGDIIFFKLKIKEYCENFGYKFVKFINTNEFITSKKVSIYASKKVNRPFIKVGVKTMYEKHLYFNDGDIIGNGFVNNIV